MYEGETKSRKRKAVCIYPTYRQSASCSTYEFASTHSELPNPQKHHIMISTSPPPISSNPILVNPKRTLSQTQPRCSHILTYPARWPDPFSPHPTTNPSSATLLPTIVTSTISPHLPPRKIHPLSAPKSKPLAFYGISLLSRSLNNPSTLRSTTPARHNSPGSSALRPPIKEMQRGR
jgi:hypothetical protein